MRNLVLALFLMGCSHEGPHVDQIVPKDQASWLGGEVKDPARAGIRHLVVYGDSLSDNGNLNRNSWGFVLPHEIFYKGRFSNGPVWAEYVENSLHWTLDDYAVGGATSYPGKFPERWVVTSLPSQIDKSEERLKELNPDQTLIVLWIGPNNYLRNGYEYQDSAGNPKVDLLKAGVARGIGAIQKAIERIERKGFHQIVVGTMPELGGINRNPRGGATASDKTLFLATKLHNEALLVMLDGLKAKAQGLKLVVFEANAINRKTYEDPKAYGFTKLDTPCYQGSLTGEFYGPKVFCDDPMGYKFWEYLHPNTRMQCYYAAQFLADVEKSSLIAGYEAEKGIARCLAIKNVSVQ